MYVCSCHWDWSSYVHPSVRWALANGVYPYRIRKWLPLDLLHVVSLEPHTGVPPEREGKHTHTHTQRESERESVMIRSYPIVRNFQWVQLPTLGNPYLWYSPHTLMPYYVHSIIELIFLHSWLASWLIIHKHCKNWAPRKFPAIQREYEQLVTCSTGVIFDYHSKLSCTRV